MRPAEIRPKITVVIMPLLCALLAACGASSNTHPSVSSAGLAAEPVRRDGAEFAKARSKLLLQPELHWSDGSTTRQGTAFVVRNGRGEHFAVTSAHYLNRQGPTLERVDLRDVATDLVVASSDVSWGRPGDGGLDDPITDLNEDLLVLPLDQKVDDLETIEVGSTAALSVGQRVWLPNKSDESAVGHVAWTGKMSELDPGFLRVELDRPIALSSQSGSPVLTPEGVLVGVLSRGTELPSGKVEILLTPSHAVFRNVTSPSQRFPLRHVVGAAGYGEKVDLRYGWTPGLRLPLAHRAERNGKSEAAIGYALVTEPHEGGIRVRTVDPRPLDHVEDAAALDAASAMIASTPAYHVDAAGVFVSLEDPTALLEKVAAAMHVERMPPDAQKAIRQMALNPDMLRALAEQSWNSEVAFWLGGSLEIGVVYALRAEAPSLVGGGAIPTITHFIATQRTACAPDDRARSCVVLLAHSQHDPAALRTVIRNLLLSAAPEDKRAELERQLASVRVFATTRSILVTRPDSLIPAYYAGEKHISIPGSRQRYDLRESVYEPFLVNPTVR